MATKEYFDFIVALEKEKEPNVEFQSRFQKKLLNFLEFQADSLKEELALMKRNYLLHKQ